MTKFVHSPAAVLPWSAAYVVNQEDKTIAMAFAFTSKKDQFSKKTGRKIAEARLDIGLSGGYGPMKLEDGEVVVKRPCVHARFRLKDLEEKPIEQVVREAEEQMKTLLQVKHNFICKC